MGMTGKTTNCFLKNEWKNAGNNHQNFMVLAGFFSLTCGNHVNMSSLSLTTLLLRESSDKPLPPYVTKTIWGDTHLALVLQLKFEKQNNFEVFYSSPHHMLFYEHQLISLPSGCLRRKSVVSTSWAASGMCGRADRSGPFLTPEFSSNHFLYTVVRAATTTTISTTCEHGGS